MATSAASYPLLPIKKRRVKGAVYRRGDVLMRETASQVLRPVCCVCAKRATFGHRRPCPVRKCRSTLHCGPRWCKTHAPDGCMDVCNRQCSEAGCTKQPVRGDIVCGEHRMERAGLCQRVRENMWTSAPAVAPPVAPPGATLGAADMLEQLVRELDK